jgi:beta-galactosidase
MPRTQPAKTSQRPLVVHSSANCRPRQFLSLFLLAVALFGVATNGRAREEQLLNSDWRFTLGEARGAETNGFDDSAWQAVSLPHNWGWEQAQQGKPVTRGPGWYRRQLKVAAQPGKRYFLRFEAASLVADVCLNGKLLGQHRGGFGAFCYEISRQLTNSGANLLAVRVDNSSLPDIAPLEGDFSVYGGLYRPVHLIVTGPENFSLTDHASPGVAWSQTSVTPAEAALDLTAQISNGVRAKNPLLLVATILDADGKVVARQEQSVALPGRETAPYFLRLTVPHPHLWNGRKDPYLYKAVAELRSTNELVMDSIEQPLGLRSYAADPEKGFLLNGQPYPLYGVNRHQDYLNKGWAISEPEMEQDLALLKELGATAVRCANYQHSDYFYSLCDKAGLLVWAELPQIDFIRNTPEFANTSRNQWLDLIRQNFNHPSIFVWSLGEEIGPRSDDPHRELQDLNELAKAEDPTRPTIQATMTSARPQMNRIPDLLGWNIFPGWYGGAKGDYGIYLDTRRASARHGSFCVSEFGAGANAAQHEQNPAQPKANGQWHPEEWQAEVHEAAWAAIKQRPYVWGAFVWCMFDFAVSARHEGGVPGLNDQGLVTFDRQTKKDAFYFYKANWSDEPVLYITSRRFTERTNSVTDVKIYANASEPELFLNGVSQGKRADGTNGVYIWKNLTLSPGENKISARAQARGQPLTDECLWNLRAPQ